MNLYGYCGNDPINWIDPYGLNRWGEDNPIGGYLWDVTDTEIGMLKGVWGGIKGIGNKIIHPVRTVRETVEGGYNLVRHPIRSAKGIYSSASMKISILLGDDREASGKVIGELWVDASAMAVASKGIQKLGSVAKTKLRPSKRLVIGKIDDLKNLKRGEYTLLDELTPDLGSPKANWMRNNSVLRKHMRTRNPIRDASPITTNSGFLRAERMLLRNRGWIYNESTKMWYPPSSSH